GPIVGRRLARGGRELVGLERADVGPPPFLVAERRPGERAGQLERLPPPVTEPLGLVAALEKGVEGGLGDAGGGGSGGYGAHREGGFRRLQVVDRAFICVRRRPGEDRSVVQSIGQRFRRRGSGDNRGLRRGRSSRRPSAS